MMVKIEYCYLFSGGTLYLNETAIFSSIWAGFDRIHCQESIGAIEILFPEKGFWFFAVSSPLVITRRLHVCHKRPSVKTSPVTRLDQVQHPLGVMVVYL